ncbi:MAG: molybdopterin oxidoreductase [Calditrichaeota bacterium]|nr:MAG: molybdopterin oxidoreductase [Calditrichota bacterium]
MKKEQKKIEFNPDRRKFLKSVAFLGGAAALSQTGCALVRTGLGPRGQYSEYHLNEPDHQIHSVCLQCHTGCPIRVKIQDGVAVKIDGNPYSPQTMVVHLPYNTPLKVGSKVDGGICPKGQAGIQSLYDPYRVVKVLKRAGKRGENKWQVISFDQAINEIVNGGKLFAHVPGEENRVVPGLKDLYKLRDPKLAKQMAGDAKAVAQGKMSVAAFKQKYARNLDVLIDPDHPDFGPINNQFIFVAGRIEHGRKEFAKRWMKGGFGSINWWEHTTICEQSHHIAFARVTDQYNKGKWSGGKDHMKPDLRHSKFIIFFGTGFAEANFGPPVMSALATDNLIHRGLKFAVVDPRLSKTAGKAWKWLPVKPGGDGALAYGMIRWMLENRAYDERYLRNANKAAAHQDNETTWTNATWLVKIEPDGPGALLRASEIGLGGKDQFVAVHNGRPAAVEPNGKTPVEGDLFYEGTIHGIRVKTAFKLLYDYAMSRSLAEWAEASGIPVQDIIEVAREFASHGKQSVAELYRGPVQHTNGYYNGQAIITLNLLVGNADWKGGLMVGGGHWHEDGSKPGQPFPVTKGLHPGKLTAFGHKLTREKSYYEQSTLFREKGYPAKRPWFPHTGNVYQEIIPSVADGYPYPVKVMFLHKGTPAFAAPGAHKAIETLVDVEKLPLFFACDIVIGETSMYADYLFPDLAIWERWGTPHQTPIAATRGSKVRQPAVESKVEKVTVFGEEMHVCMETIMLAIAEKLGLPGYGENGFGPGMPFKRMEDFYLKMVANIAAGDKPGDAVPDANAEELDIFRKARAHLSKAVFDEAKWRRAVVDASGTDWWKKVVYVLNRGGRYEDYQKYQESGDKVPHKFGKMFNLYVESVALTHHSYTGKRFSGLAVVEPPKAYDGSVVDDTDFPLRLITHKDILGGQSRTLPTDYWLSTIKSENTIWINPRTARELGLKKNDVVRLISATNPDGLWDLKNGQKIPMEGKIYLTEGIRPGTVTVSWHFGHWAYGANDVLVDGQHVEGDPRRRKGLCPNAAMRLDPALKNVCLQDLIGGSASFYDTRVRLVKVGHAEPVSIEV